MTNPELVTVVIPAHNEERFLGACLESVREQDYPDLQIVVVDNASTDDTAGVVEQHRRADPRVELVQTDQLSIPKALNLGVARARGRWLVRVDAHSTIPPTYVRTGVDHLRQGGWGGVGGRKDGVGVTHAGRAIAVAMSSRLAVGNSVYHFGTSGQEVDHLPFGAYPVSLVREAGGWDEGLTANEDFEFDYRLRRAGRRLWFDPTMVIRWHCRQSLPDLFRQYVRYGRGKVDVAMLHPDSLSPRHLAPPLLVVYLAGAVLAATRRPGLDLGHGGAVPARAGHGGDQVGTTTRAPGRTGPGAGGDRRDARRVGPRLLLGRTAPANVAAARDADWAGVTRVGGHRSPSPRGRARRRPAPSSCARRRAAAGAGRGCGPC